MNKQAIPTEHIKKIDFAVQSGLCANSWELMAILSAGLTGDTVYKISVLNKQYVVKLENTHDDYFDLHRNYSILKIVSDYKISPDVCFTDPVQGIILMNYIEPKPQMQTPPEAIQKMSHVLRQLHAIALFPAWKSVVEVLGSIYQKLPMEYKQNSLIEDCINQVKNMQNILFDKSDIRSCHGDLNPVNVLYDGENHYLIDWQAASPQSFYFDLAYYANWFYFYSEDLMELFLNTYLQRNATDEEKAKFYLMRIFVNIYLGIGFISIPLKSNSSFTIEAHLETLPSYLQFMQLLGSGQVKLQDPVVQQQFGFIFLNNAIHLMNDRYRLSYQFLLSRRF